MRALAFAVLLLDCCWAHNWDPLAPKFGTSLYRFRGSSSAGYSLAALATCRRRPRQPEAA